MLIKFLKVPIQNKLKNDMIKSVHYTSIDSTNDEAKRRIRSQNSVDTMVIVADKQTKGRGQFDRVWYSDDMGGLYYTFVKPIHEERSLVPQEIISCVSDAIVRCLKQMDQCPVEIEWPNDLILEDKKLGGILVETISSENMGWSHIIVGVGLNINQSSFPDSLKHSAISLKQWSGNDYNKSTIAMMITKELDACL